MDKDVTEQLDKVTGLWIAVAIGFSKHIEYTITEIFTLWFTFKVAGVDLTVWALYGILWMGTLSFILLLKTAGNGGESDG